MFNNGCSDIKLHYMGINFFTNFIIDSRDISRKLMKYFENSL